MRFFLLRMLPKSLSSKLLGKLSSTLIHPKLLLKFIKGYCAYYQVDLSVVKKPLEEMKNFDEFFTRELKDGARPIDKNKGSIVSPVDGVISEFGELGPGFLTQTKGVLYSLADLVGSSLALEFLGGFYLTIYLSPSHYHRIHSPIAGKVNEYSCFSGSLWPVNELGIQNVGSLLCQNERILTLLENPKGKVALIKVGATIVGKISLTYSDLKTNTGYKTKLGVKVKPEKTYEKGEEVATFHIGSTVILLFQKNQISPHQLEKGKQILMGQKIATYL